MVGAEYGSSHSRGGHPPNEGTRWSERVATLGAISVHLTSATKGASSSVACLRSANGPLVGLGPR